MTNNKIRLSVIILVILILAVGGIAIKTLTQNKGEGIENEYTPQEEISDEQTRETIATLYFIDKESNTVKPEARLVNVKDIIISPYTNLVQLLIDGPKNDKLEKLIPDDTKILNASIDGEVLTLDFSNQLLNYDKKKQNVKENMIKSIVNTVTELNEVNKVKILIEGIANTEFSDEYVRK